MKCTDCKYCIQIEYGYTNWSVEGITADCLLKLNPDFPEDEFYGEESSLLFASNCPTFIKGDPVYVDVDRIGGDLQNYSNDAEIKELLIKKEKLNEQ